MKKKVWTASVNMRHCVIVAQAKSSKFELIRRLENDDPAWRGEVEYSMRPMFSKKSFKRGLAIKAYIPAP